MLNYPMQSTEIKCEFLLLKEVSDINFTPKVEHGLKYKKDSYTILILRIIYIFFKL